MARKVSGSIVWMSVTTGPAASAGGAPAGGCRPGVWAWSAAPQVSSNASVAAGGVIEGIRASQRGATRAGQPAMIADWTTLLEL